jgi:hypothetical protein
MSVTYILVDILYNLILPAGLVFIVLTLNITPTSDRVWRESM